MTSELLSGLNASQASAVTFGNGPLLVVAGAGSGKTRVLTRRIAYLVDQGVSPGAILAITFTNKAAGEMKARVGEMVGIDIASRMWVSTFHSACVRILRSHAEALGYRGGFVIYDQNDARRLLEYVVRDMALDPKRFPTKAVLGVISSAKSQALSPREYGDSSHGMYERKVAEIYASYQQRLLDSNAMDFDDLLLNAVRLFEKNPEVLLYYQRRFSYLLVDEFQDTNKVQNRLVSLLGAAHGNVFVVGDSDQSIYRFRGAHMGNILEFEENFPGAQVIALEENFRSTQSILDAANAVIGHNPRRHRKNLYSSKGRGESIVLYEASDDRDEAAYVASDIAVQTSRGDRAFSDFAVFFRTNSQSRGVEEQLGSRGIPYRLVGGVPFFERKEVKDVVAYLKLASNPDDEVSFRRVINVPKRGIGEVTLAKLLLSTKARDGSLLDCILRAASSISSKKLGAELLSFVELVRGVAEMAREGIATSVIIERVLEDSGYRQSLRSVGDFEAESRLENLAELQAYAEEHRSLEEFLEVTALYSSADSEMGDSTVTLMTLHMAKGLEFPVVYLVGLEDGIFPHMRSLTDPAELQEERRLFYVGITRAMEKLYLTYSRQRLGFGEMMFNPPSRFIPEIPEELLTQMGSGEPDYGDRSYFSSSRRTATLKEGSSEFSWPGAARSREQISTSQQRLRPGQRVFHDKWGEGVVVEVSGFGQREEATVRFADFGTKRLVVALAALRSLGDL